MIRPTGSPLRELTTQLAGLAGAPRVILVVDQFEELFTGGEEQAERDAFIAALHAAAARPDDRRELPQALVVAAIRADFLGRIIAYPPLRAVLDAGLFAVGPMSEAELRLAMTGPAAEAGLTVEPGLVEAVIAELREGAAGEPGSGALPLMSQAMAATWERREGNELTLRAYRLAGRAHPLSPATRYQHGVPARRPSRREPQHPVAARRYRRPACPHRNRGQRRRDRRPRRRRRRPAARHRPVPAARHGKPHHRVRRAVNRATARRGRLARLPHRPGQFGHGELLTGQQRSGMLPGDPANGGATAVAFSPDGTLLATADADGYVRLWDPATGQAVGAPLPVDPGYGVTGVAFSPGGTLLATADADGTVQTWQLPLFTDPYAACAPMLGHRPRPARTCGRSTRSAARTG